MTTAPKFLLCGTRACPWVQRTAIVLLRKRAPFDRLYLDGGTRPDWFASMSPHGKVPVLIIDGSDALFESCAIVEYLDETVAPRLHPEDPIQRARNRAWTDFLPTFARAATRPGYASSEAEFAAAAQALDEPFSRLEDALSRRGNAGPFFNGESFSLVDAGYASILQRHWFINRLHPAGEIGKYPLLAAWRDALLATPEVKASTVPDVEEIWRRHRVRRNAWLAQFISNTGIPADNSGPHA